MTMTADPGGISAWSLRRSLYSGSRKGVRPSKAGTKSKQSQFIALLEGGWTVLSQSYGRGMFRDMGPFENEGVDMPSELSRWVVLSSLRFKVEKDTPFLKVLKASFFCLKDMPITSPTQIGGNNADPVRVFACQQVGVADDAYSVK